MQVSTKLPFRVVYSIHHHELLGYLLGAYIVQQNGRGEDITAHQRIFETNLHEFRAAIDDIDVQIIRILAYIHHENIAKAYSERVNRSSKKINTEEVLLKILKM